MTRTTRPASRRDFIKDTGLLLGGAWLGLTPTALVAAAEAARELEAQGAPLSHIEPADALTLGAVADQVWPPDDTAGGRELGAVHFMDFAAGGFMAGAWPMVREGIADLDRRSREAHEADFADLDFDTQTAVLAGVEDTPFFSIAHFLTLLGCFCLPEYGGNRDHQGWAQIGFDRRHAWLPPFGFYDANPGETS